MHGSFTIPIEEDMMLNEPAAPMELDTDRMDLDLMTGNPQASHQHHHHHRHHHHHNHHLLTEDPILALHGARHKRKMKLQDLALRESRDPQGLLEQPEIIDNKRRHGDTPAKGVKSKHSYKDYLPGEKRLKVHREYRDDGTESKLRKEKERSEKLQRLTRVRSESRASSPRGSTPATPVDNTLTEDGPFAFGSRRQPAEASPATPTGTGRPRPFICEIEDCGKRFVDALQLERHIERHGPKELECDLDMCGKLFSSLMLLRRHQSMVHKRRSEKWENPPGITRQRPGRSRRREPRIVASGDVVDPVELDRKTRTWVEVEQSGGDYSDEDDGDDEEITTRTPTKKPKESTELKQTKQPKAEERSSTKGNIKKKLVAKTEDIKSGADVDRAGRSDDGEHSARQTKGQEDNGKAAPAGPRPRPFHCTYDDCKKVFIDAIQLERHLERHGPKELECGIDGCRKRFSAQMLLRRHQSMVHKRRSPAVPVSINKGLHHQKASSTTAVATSLLNPSTAWPLSKSEAKSSSPSLQSSNEIAPLSAPASAPRSQGYNESGKK
ncbi:hypothetical protein BCR41DRAFT_375287 [Lobosporangium transversale]|uniref:C2H2-type domain-containing protein n=1 Tax=Lobosporangium transversale TaxID=64571 RepID=A0A1Y2G7I7_9FUNG|nr:hypothetical protein BCR41DRAFT_375287 [Lobosporangium transversale]ORZ00031.1 hypothetical protein BCR41DRAFT_375287 [Lobosporangium transversale]|eukprot:XP_021876072.1 hypothetical protein BCR41DRAFT_375287 [Lobosporangium transversale]